MIAAPQQVLTYARECGGRFQISASALGVIRSFIQNDRGRPEAGGVLLGRHIHGTADVIVDSVTSPMVGDRAQRLSFFRSRRRHQEAVDRIWDKSHGTCTYLGGWHTHPESDPTPSRVDWLDWRRHLLVDRYTTALFFVIAGTRVVRAWEGRRCSRIVALRLINGE
jgi:integrative and conjugative element protein (TIGR02256 family)